jgi:hypothetical protein
MQSYLADIKGLPLNVLVFSQARHSLLTPPRGTKLGNAN